MSRRRDVLQTTLNISHLRPDADMSLEQYLMTPESMASQVGLVSGVLKGKKVMFLGDDDHMSVVLSRHLEVNPIVVEYDSRIISSLEGCYERYGIQDYILEKYDARNPMRKGLCADAFYINPPYSSKNNGRGAKVWLSRVAKAVPVGSVSVLVYPIDEDLPWTMECVNEILQYAYGCGLMIVDIDRDAHTYEHLPNDPGLLSSNIFLYKFKEVNPKEVEGIDGASLYR